MPDSYWIKEYKIEIDKAKKQISHYENLSICEKKQTKPNYTKLCNWYDEIKKYKRKLKIRTKELNELTNK